jgi:hypothetical protein
LSFRFSLQWRRDMLTRESPIGPAVSLAGYSQVPPESLNPHPAKGKSLINLDYILDAHFFFSYKKTLFFIKLMPSDKRRADR